MIVDDLCGIPHGLNQHLQLGSDLGKVRKVTYKGQKVFQGRTLPQSNAIAAVRTVVAIIEVSKVRPSPTTTWQQQSVQLSRILWSEGL